MVIIWVMIVIIWESLVLYPIIKKNENIRAKIKNIVTSVTDSNEDIRVNALPLYLPVSSAIKLLAATPSLL